MCKHALLSVNPFTSSPLNIASCHWLTSVQFSQSQEVSLKSRVLVLLPAAAAAPRRVGSRSSGIMGVLSTLVRGLVRGADRMSEWTSKRGPRYMNRGRTARITGLRTSSRKFVPIQEMIPQFVVPNLEGFKLKPYVSYRTPKGSEPPLTAESLFEEVVAPQIKKDFEEGTLNLHDLKKYGFEPTQEGKLFKLYPKNYVR